jgi:RNA polymerase sigma-70 factor (ECF subfamily)
MGAVMTAPEPHEVGELYDRYAHVIFLRARGILGSDEEAHDAVQETFAKVISNWEQFRGESSPLTWMYRISTNLCLNRLRNRKGHERKHAAHPEEISGPATAWLRDDLDTERLRQLLAEEDAETRAIVLYVYFDDMTREETAVLVGLSVPTVRKRLNQFLYRARKAFGVPAEAILATAFATLMLLGIFR